MKNSILKFGMILNKKEQKLITGGFDASSFPNCGTKHCDEQQGFFCNGHGVCLFLGYYE